MRRLLPDDDIIDMLNGISDQPIQCSGCEKWSHWAKEQFQAMISLETQLINKESELSSVFLTLTAELEDKNRIVDSTTESIRELQLQYSQEKAKNVEMNMKWKEKLKRILQKKSSEKMRPEQNEN